MKITDFEIGKKYRHRDWITQTFAGYFGEMSYLKIYNQNGNGVTYESAYPPYHHEALSDDWYEVNDDSEELTNTKEQLKEAIRIIEYVRCLINPYDTRRFQTFEAIQKIDHFLQQQKETK